MVTKGLNKITQNETQDLQLVDNFCKSRVNKITQNETQALQLVDNFCKSWVGKDNNPCAQKFRLWKIKMAGVLGFEPR